MGEGTGSVAGDTSGNSRNGTITGATWQIEERLLNILVRTILSDYGGVLLDLGRSLYFSGVGYVSTSAFALSGTVLTIGGWIKSKINTSFIQTIIGEAAVSATTGYLRIDRNDSSDGIRVWYADGVAQRSANMPTFFTGYDDTWVHFTVVVDYSAKIIKWYRNGVLLQTSAMVGTPVFPSTDRIKYLGTFSSTLHRLTEGNLDDIRIYNRELSDVEIIKLSKNQYVDSSDLQGHWKFDEGSGLLANDSSGNDRNGTLSDLGVSWDNGKASGEILNILVNLILSDTAIGNDVLNILVRIALSDTGSATDAMNILVNIYLTDSVVGAEIVRILNSLVVSDGGNAVEAVAILAVLSVADSGSGIDVISLIRGIIIRDSGAGSELVRILNSFAVSDTGIGIEALRVLTGLIIQDAGVGSEEIYIKNFIGLHDSGLAIEAAKIFVELAIQDNGESEELVNLIRQIKTYDSGLGADIMLLVKKIYPYTNKTSPYSNKNSPYNKKTSPYHNLPRA